MSETYCIRLPIQLPGGNRISDVDPAVEMNVLGLPAELSREDEYYVLTVKGIGSEEEAKALLRQLYAAVCWAGLELKTGIKALAEAQPVTYYDDPVKTGKNLGLGRPVDVIIETTRPAIYREGKRAGKITAGSVTAILSNKAERFLGALAQGLARANPEAFEADGQAAVRLETAMELYVLSYFEPHSVPRFLLQCTALEVLVPPAEAEPDRIIEQVNEWMAQAHAKAAGVTDGAERKDFERLADNIGRMKRRSHGQRIRAFARARLEAMGVADIDETVARLVRAYNVRGRFLHDGNRKDIGEATTALHDVLPLLLKAVLQKAD